MVPATAVKSIPPDKKGTLRTPEPIAPDTEPETSNAEADVKVTVITSATASSAGVMPVSFPLPVPENAA